jgi:LemA protein
MEFLQFKWVVLAVLVSMALWAVFTYNTLVSLKHTVVKAFSNIDVLLKQRHEELPKLVETCRQYMQHERDTLERVTQARNAVAAASAAGNLGALGDAENALRRGLGALFAVAENYPNLKADETFRNLQSRISALENGIADRRELYNEAVNLNNVKVETFPDVLIARFFGFRTQRLLQFSASEVGDVDVRGLFKA